MNADYTEKLGELRDLVEMHYKARPAFSVEMSKAKTAQELGDKIASSWLGYGLKGDNGQMVGNDYKLTVNTKPETFDGAMKYLWYKPTTQPDGSVWWKMMGLPFVVKVVTTGEKHDITVSPA